MSGRPSARLSTALNIVVSVFNKASGKNFDLIATVDSHDLRTKMTDNALKVGNHNSIFNIWCKIQKTGLFATCVGARNTATLGWDELVTVKITENSTKF